MVFRRDLDGISALVVPTLRGHTNCSWRFSICSQAMFEAIPTHSTAQFNELATFFGDQIGPSC